MSHLIFIKKNLHASLSEKDMRQVFKILEQGLATPAEILDRRVEAHLDRSFERMRESLAAKRDDEARLARVRRAPIGSYQSQIDYSSTAQAIFALGGVGRLATEEPPQARLESFLTRRERSSWPQEMRLSSTSKIFGDPLVLSMLRRIPEHDAQNVINRLLLRAASTHEASLASAAMSLGANPLDFIPTLCADGSATAPRANLLGALLLRPKAGKSLQIHSSSRHDDSLLLGSVLLATSLVSAADLPALMSLRPEQPAPGEIPSLDAFGEAMRNAWPNCAEALAALAPNIGASLFELDKSGWTLAEGAKEAPAHRLPLLERAHAFAESRAIGDSAASLPTSRDLRSKLRI